MKLKYCIKCLMPTTKLHLNFTNGVCNTCVYYKSYKNSKKRINWNARQKEFNKLIKEIKKVNAPSFDALVPVSGGKDSIFQVERLLNKGLRILAVNIDYGIKTKIGITNLQTIPNMGATLITVRPNLEIHKKILKISFLKYGDPDLMSHCMLHAFPIRVALNFKIPLVLLGENSAIEYSGSVNKYDEKRMNNKWFEKYAANSGITPKFFSRKHGIEYKYLKNYDLPSDAELKKTNAVFASYFFKWDSQTNLRIAKKYGFKSLKKRGEGTYRNFVGIDEKINRIHQYLKYLKFGYGRATDHACEDIRSGKISRTKAKKLVMKFDRVPISKFYYKEFINLIGINENFFFATLRKYTNKKLFNIQKKNFLFKFKKFG
jgi:N-acetyl sugar amidotransferase